MGNGRKWRVAVARLVAISCLAVAIAGCASNKPGQLPQAAADDRTGQQLEQFDRLADDMYKLAAAGKFADARGVLIQMSDMMPGLPLKGATSVEGVQALADAIVQAKRTYSAVRMTAEDALASAGRVRLTVDALTHANDPMWRQYGKLMKENAASLEQALVRREAEQATRVLAELGSRFDTIRPAALVSGKQADIAKLDSLFLFLRARVGVKPDDSLIVTVGQLKEAIDHLFGIRDDQTAYMPMGEPRNPLFVSLMLGTMIATALAYAAWRMARAQYAYGGRAKHDRGKRW